MAVGFRRAKTRQGILMEKISRYQEKLDKVREELNLLEQKDSEFTLKITSLAQSEGFINENMLRASEGKDTVPSSLHRLSRTVEILVVRLNKNRMR